MLKKIKDKALKILSKIYTFGEDYDVIKETDYGFIYISWDGIVRKYYVCIYSYDTESKVIVSKGFNKYDLAKEYAEKVPTKKVTHLIKEF